jgi:hypothetical protein
LLDTAGIVREAIFHSLTPFQLSGISAGLFSS